MEEAAPPDDLVLRQVRIDAARRILASLHVTRRLARREGAFDVLEAILVTLVFSGVIVGTVLANTWLAELNGRTYMGMLRSNTSWAILHAMGFVIGGLPLVVVVILAVPIGIGRIGPSLERWRGRSRRRAIEAKLRAEGCVCAVVGDGPPDPRLEGDLLTVAKEHPDLELAGERRCLRPKIDAAAWSCPSCAAPLSTSGAGLRACNHCGYERFEPLRAQSEALIAAERVLAKLVGEKEPNAAPNSKSKSSSTPPLTPRDRDALWRSFRGAGTDELSAQTIGLTVAVLVFLAISELGRWLGIGFIEAFGRGFGGLFGLATAALIPMAIYTTLRRRWREFRPGVAAYDAALADDIVTVLALRGEATFEEMASHLGVSKAHVMEVLAALDARAGLPLYVDHRGERLISLHARAIDDRGCPACGADLRVAPRARLRCEHCGGSFMGVVAA